MSLRDLATAAIETERAAQKLREGNCLRVVHEVRAVAFFEAVAIVSGGSPRRPIYGPGGLLELTQAILAGEETCGNSGVV